VLAAGGLWLPVLHNLASLLEHGESACGEVGAATLSVPPMCRKVHQIVLLMDRFGENVVAEFIKCHYRHSRRSDAYRHRLRF
jgi:hypothetical protein